MLIVEDILPFESIDCRMRTLLMINLCLEVDTSEHMQIVWFSFLSFFVFRAGSFSYRRFLGCNKKYHWLESVHVGDLAVKNSVNKLGLETNVINEIFSISY